MSNERGLDRLLHHANQMPRNRQNVTFSQHFKFLTNFDVAEHIAASKLLRYFQRKIATFQTCQIRRKTTNYSRAILPGKVEVKVVFAMVVDRDDVVGGGGSTPVMTFNGSSLTNVCLFSQTVGAVYQRLESHHPARPVIFLPVATYGALPLSDDGSGQCGVKFCDVFP